MKIYNKKSEILRDLGKDAKDIRYLERAVERGEVVEISGYYIIKDELVGYTINILLRDNKELKEKVESFSDISEKLEEAKANEEYYKQDAEESRDRLVAAESILDELRAKGFNIGYANE
jgi:predicted deacetylase